MIVSGLIYQDEQYWIYPQDDVFIVCKDDTEKNYADVIGCSSTFTGAKAMIEQDRSKKD